MGGGEQHRADRQRSDRPSGWTRAPRTSARQIASSSADFAMSTAPRARRRSRGSAANDEAATRRRASATNAAPPARTPSASATETGWASVGSSGRTAGPSNPPTPPWRTRPPPPDRGSRHRAGYPSGDEVQRGLVDAVDAEESVDVAVVEASDREGRESERGPCEQDVLRHVPGLDQREAVRARAVLEPRPPEHGAHRDDRRARRQRRAVGREIVPGRRVEWSDELEAVAEGVVVMQRKPETLDAMAGAVELEGVQRPTGRHGPEVLRGSFDGPRDAVRGVEHGREVSESERVRRETHDGSGAPRVPRRAFPGRVRVQGAGRSRWRRAVSPTDSQ